MKEEIRNQGPHHYLVYELNSRSPVSRGWDTPT